MGYPLGTPLELMGCTMGYPFVAPQELMGYSLGALDEHPIS
jgi:hypothetical protein